MALVKTDYSENPHVGPILLNYPSLPSPTRVFFRRVMMGSVSRRVSDRCGAGSRCLGFPFPFFAVSTALPQIDIYPSWPCSGVHCPSSRCQWRPVPQLHLNLPAHAFLKEVFPATKT